MNSISTRTLILLVLLLLSSPLFGLRASGFPNIPGPGHIEDIIDDVQDIDDIIRNGNFGLGMNDEPGITTSIDDCVTDVPFLDNYVPWFYFPICELPKTVDGSYVGFPGCYHGNFQSFCMHAGTYAPSSGDGYLYAPIRGSLAGPIESILWNSADHPEIPQTDVQSLIWALQSRTKISDMSTERQAVARALLTPDQIRDLNGSALDVIDSAIFNDVFGSLNVAPGIRSVLEAEATMRSMFTSGNPLYSELEAVAVLTGDPQFGEDARDVPLGRWSYHPDGYFIRYFPRGYSELHVDYSIPDICDIVRDDSDNRITSVSDQRGNLLEIEYGNSRDIWDISTMRFSRMDLSNPSQNVISEYTHLNVSQPDRSWVTRHQAEVDRITGSTDLSASITQIGILFHVLESAGVEGGILTLLQEAWQGELVEIMHSQVQIPDKNPQKDLPDFDWRSRWSPIDPGGSANPGNTGRQRLGNGRSPRPSQDPDWSHGDDPRIKDYDPDEETGDEGSEESNNSPGREAFNRGKEVIGWFGYGQTGVDIATGGVEGWATGAIGNAIPNEGFSIILDFIFDVGGRIADALGQDPPRNDYDIYAEPENFSIPGVESNQNIPQERADAMNAVLESGSEMISLLGAAVVSLDRQGGAVLAGNDEWAENQAFALMHYKREGGIAMLQFASDLENFLNVIRSEGLDDTIITPSQIEDYQHRLSTTGFNQSEMNVASILGYSDSEIDDLLERRINGDPFEESGSVMAHLEESIVIMRRMGIYLVCLSGLGA